MHIVFSVKITDRDAAVIHCPDSIEKLFYMLLNVGIFAKMLSLSEGRDIIIVPELILCSAPAFSNAGINQKTKYGVHPAGHRQVGYLQQNSLQGRGVIELWK